MEPLKYKYSNKRHYVDKHLAETEGILTKHFHIDSVKRFYPEVKEREVAVGTLIRSDSTNTAANYDSAPLRGGKRLSPHKLHSEDIKGQTKRHIDLKVAYDEIHFANRRHFNTGSSKKEYDFIFWNKKKPVLDETGLSISRKESSERSLDTEINRKQHISSKLQQRNWIPESSAGDKFYKDADREPGFYAAGGLVTGSTVALKPSARPPMPSTLVMKKGSTDTDIKLFAMEAEGGPPVFLSYADKEAFRQQEAERRQVMALTEPQSTRQGVRVPSWEERTGAWLVDPAAGGNDDDDL